VQIGILGTGTLAAALGTAWDRAGHELVIGGRSPDKAEALAGHLGSSARAAAPREVASSAAVLLAVPWTAAADVLRDAGADEGTMRGTVLLDPTNAVEHGVGVLQTPAGVSAAQQIATLALGAQVVKAFHLLPADHWATIHNPGTPPMTVPLCGDDSAAVTVVAGLVRDAGATPAILGSLHRARQLEEVAGFVIGLAFAGSDPNSAIPRIAAPTHAHTTPAAVQLT
jgi:predicted dinucleotide-binding enzyme